ncbi:MAG: hypothetical protein WA977_10060 [Halobacteriota archaeon]
MLKDERGQMSIDFLAGLSLFMLALLFLAQFIPGMFVPFQSETIDLSSVSYRTSVILVEDPGWWDNGTCNNTDWENHNDSVSRVGLAFDKDSPNMLDMSKINAFNDGTLDLTDKLGLYRNINGNRLNYSYNITLWRLNETIMATWGETSPEYGDVSSMKRLVNAQTGTVLILEWGELKGDPHANDKALFNITEPKEDITIIIEGMEIFPSNGNPRLECIKAGLNPNPANKLDMGTEYWVWIDNSTGSFEEVIETGTDPNIGLPPYPYNATSRLKIKISKNALDPSATNYIEVKFLQVLIHGEPCINLDELEKVVIYKNAILKVKIWT